MSGQLRYFVENITVKDLVINLAGFFRLFILMLLAAVFDVTASEAIKILNINPGGKDVPAARQIAVQFNRAVVPIDRMDRKREEIPVTISPQLDYQWALAGSFVTGLSVGRERNDEQGDPIRHYRLARHQDSGWRYD